MRQKDVFLQSEADAWFERNRAALADKDFSVDPICCEVERIAAGAGKERLKILEVGCGEGLRLAWLNEKFGSEVAGVDPSEKAVAAANARGVIAKRGTADSLDFKDAQFDILVFGFCLYLCDPDDLFRIAQEANRVLYENAWLIIHDFFASSPLRREYSHRAGLYSRKMDFRRLFDWHPSYTCYSHRVAHHQGGEYTDDLQEWVAVSVLRKTAWQ
jgi:ubiquinone/menaquinone biosynthesis C-methylase UbiE